MEAFLSSIESAFIIFPVIALVFTIPYIIYEYHKYGAIPAYRSLIIYSFLLYMLCSYFLVILPLPEKSMVMQMKIPQYNLIPFHFISEIAEKTSFHVSDFATYFPSLKNPVFYEAVFNVFLLIPFGIYLRYYFNLNLKKTMFYSFCYTLFFELTQLTGLYFIYPRGYRVFDVDDLLLNTLGGVIGYFIGNALSKVLPSQEEINEAAYKDSKNISIFRRYTCQLVDLIIIFLLLEIIYLLMIHFQIFTEFVAMIIFILIIMSYYLVIPLFLNHGTLMMNFFHLRYKTSKKLTMIKLASYYFFKLYIYALIPLSLLGISFILYQKKIIPFQVLKYFCIAIFTFTLLTYVITLLKRILKRQTIPEKLSKVTIESTLKK